MKLTELKYRTLDEVLADVAIDFQNFDMEDLIRPAQLIKVVQKVNYDLGLKIHTPKDAIVEVINGKGKLPDDFYVLNYAVICSGKKKIKVTSKARGTHREDMIITCPKCQKPQLNDCGYPETDVPEGYFDPMQLLEVIEDDDCCLCDAAYTTRCGEKYTVIQKRGLDVTVFEELLPINIKPGKWVDSECCNIRNRCREEGEIKNGYIYTNLNAITLFINYLGNLEDDEGNLLTLDNPYANEYYEAAIKERILYNLFMNDESIEKKWIYAKQELREARNRALGVVNMPDFKEINQFFGKERKKFIKKYFEIFR